VLLGVNAAVEDDLTARPSHHDNEEDHDHDDFESFVIELPPQQSPALLAERAAQAAADYDVLRIKGFAAVDGKPMRLLVQAVGSRVETRYERPWENGAARSGRLVVIGLKGLDQAGIAKLLQGAR
jgi:cobalamin biosynthesis protein CobW